MTDEYPAWVWQVVTDYVLDPIDYKKIHEYLKAKYGRKKPKIQWAIIEEIVKAPSTIDERPKITVVSFPHVRCSENGALYYFRLNTHFDIAEDSYRIEQEGFIWVSEVLGQVLKRTVTLYYGKESIITVGDKIERTPKGHS